RRMPYILVGVPIAVVAFVAIPLVWWFMPGEEFPSGIIPLFAFMIAINIFNVAMASYRSPVVALMPDLIPAEDRSVANGAINLMGALGSVIAFAGGKLVVGIGRGIGKTMGSTDGDEMGFLFGFGMTGIVMILSLIVLYFAIKEPKTPFGRELEEKVSLKGSFHEVFTIQINQEFSCYWLFSCGFAGTKRWRHSFHYTVFILLVLLMLRMQLSI
ncbi:MAG: hypothetical protein ACTSP4_10975, partial [Candidatus Hodarchaeales archaeon]